MAGNVYTWSTTAADNDDADSAINWAEGQLPSTVNDSARGMMAAQAGWLKDNNATLATGGTGSAYTVTSNIAISALATGLRLTLKASATNSAGATLNVTPSGGAAFGAKSIRVLASTGERATVAGEIQNTGHYMFEYDTALNSAAGGWALLNPTPIPTGASTVQVFTSGSGTYTTPTGVKWIEVQLVGGGGGGGGGAGGGNGGNGGNTTFSTLTGTGGTGGANGGNGGGGQTASGGDVNITGGGGDSGQVGTAATACSGGGGGSSVFGGGGAIQYANAGQAAAANTGAGGGGGGIVVVGITQGGGGGGAGGYCSKTIASPSATYSYAVGAAGSAGTSSGNSAAGGAGAAGIIIVREYY